MFSFSGVQTGGMIHGRSCQRLALRRIAHPLSPGLDEKESIVLELDVRPANCFCLGSEWQKKCPS